MRWAVHFDAPDAHTLIPGTLRTSRPCLLIASSYFQSNMSSRNRARGASNQDADEERRLWKEILDRSREVDVMVVSAGVVW